MQKSGYKEKKEQERLFEQKNKKHAAGMKMKDRRKKKKDLKKQKKERHLKYLAKRKTLERRQNQATVSKLDKYLKKFLDVYPPEDDIEDFLDIFKTVDDGGTVGGLEELPNPRVGMLIAKILKHLGLRKNKDGEFELKNGRDRSDAPRHEQRESFYAKIRRKVDRLKKQKQF